MWLPALCPLPLLGVYRLPYQPGESGPHPVAALPRPSTASLPRALPAVVSSLQAGTPTPLAGRGCG